MLSETPIMTLPWFKWLVSVAFAHSIYITSLTVSQLLLLPYVAFGSWCIAGFIVWSPIVKYCTRPWVILIQGTEQAGLGPDSKFRLRSQYVFCTDGSRAGNNVSISSSLRKANMI